MNYNLPIGMGGGNSTYSAPAIEVIDIATEKGFSASNDRPDNDYDSNDNGNY